MLGMHTVQPWGGSFGGGWGFHYFDLHVKCCAGDKAKYLSLRVAQFPITLISTGLLRGSHWEGYVDAFTWVGILAKIKAGWPIHLIATDKHDTIGGGPYARTDIVNPPGFSEGFARREICAVRHSDVSDKGRQIAGYGG